MRSVPDDARLPKVFEGLVLVSEALTTIGLEVQGRRDKARLRAELVESGGEEAIIVDIKQDVQGQGIVKPIIGAWSSSAVNRSDFVELLAQLNQFLPRVKPFRAEPVSLSTDSNPDLNASTQAQAPSTLSLQESLPFLNIKRDLVRLLSVLTFEDKVVCDQVRKYGGVQVILGLCEVDERNPCESIMMSLVVIDI
jgi:ataxin-10